jgi:nitrogen-specific signal transduction histidine kinase
MSTSVFVVSEVPLAGASLVLQNIGKLSDITSPQVSRLDVLILPLSIPQNEENRRFLHLLKAKNPALQFILVANPTSSSQELCHFLREFTCFFILEQMQMQELEVVALRALEHAQQLRQAQALETLVSEQNESLRSLYRELESRIQKRQAYLQEARDKAEAAHLRWKLLLSVSEALQGSSSLGQIESLLDYFIREEFKLSSLRIVLGSQTSMMRSQLSRHKSTLWTEISLFAGEEGSVRGSLFLLKTETTSESSGPREKSFLQKDELDFFNKLAEIVALAIDRIDQFEQNLALQQHWQATFNAVAEPVMIINSQYEVLQSNSAFLKKASAGKKCYERLFQRNSPCEDCRLGKTFRLEDKLLLEVHSHPLKDFSSRDSLYVNQYHDITEQTAMEKKILEAARLAEIGTIGSSIAHELNNPIGGMLSYAQLIKMDLAEDHPFYPEIIAIEAGLKKCRDIVQNLLGFSRNPVLDGPGHVDLREVVTRAIKIVELQSKSFGVEIRWTPPSLPLRVLGNAGYLTQALQNVLQYSLQNILQESRTFGSVKGLIEISLSLKNERITVQVMDNGPVQEHWTSLGMSMAHKIIRDHSGTLEFFEDTKPFHSICVSFPYDPETP